MRVCVWVCVYVDSRHFMPRFIPSLMGLNPSCQGVYVDRQSRYSADQLAVANTTQLSLPGRLGHNAVAAITIFHFQVTLLPRILHGRNQ